MKLKAAYLYQLTDYRRAVIIFYSAIIAVLVLISLSFVRVGFSGTATFSGFDFATAVFVFVMGLCSFREPFLLLAQNGVSRKSAYQSRILVSVTISCILAVIDKVLLLIAKAIESLTEGLRTLSFIEHVYNITLNGTFPNHIMMLIYDFLMYLAAAAAGYLITLIFYRLNKYGKVAVGAGVPIFLIFIFPILDYALFQARISMAAAQVIDFAFGIQAQNPYMGMATLALLFAVFSLLSWALIRRADVKR
jgi:hypothetical protein